MCTRLRDGHTSAVTSTAIAAPWLMRCEPLLDDLSKACAPEAKDTLTTLREFHILGAEHEQRTYIKMILLQDISEVFEGSLNAHGVLTRCHVMIDEPPASRLCRGIAIEVYLVFRPCGERLWRVRWHQRKWSIYED